MKWNDRFLPYSGERKSIIYNYILEVVQRLREKKKPLSNIYVINFILNDNEWDIKIFGNKENHDWFVSEFKTNPFLLDFINDEISKMATMPDIYLKELSDELRMDDQKTLAFSQIIQNFIVTSPTTQHHYFCNIDLDEIRKITDEYVKKNFRKFRMRRGALEYKYLNLCKAQRVLEDEMGIETEIVSTPNGKLMLRGKQNDFSVNITRWGDFPAVSKKPQNTELFCIMDDISIYVFGFVPPELIQKNSDEKFLFSNDKTKTEHLTAFIGFNETVFSNNK